MRPLRAYRLQRSLSLRCVPLSSSLPSPLPQSWRVHRVPTSAGHSDPIPAGIASQLSGSLRPTLAGHHHGTLPDRVRGLYGPDNGQNAGQGPAIMVANLEPWTYRLTLLLPCACIRVTSLQCCRQVNQWRVKFLRLVFVTMHISLNQS